MLNLSSAPGGTEVMRASLTAPHLLPSGRVQAQGWIQWAAHRQSWPPSLGTISSCLPLTNGWEHSHSSITYNPESYCWHCCSVTQLSRALCIPWTAAHQASLSFTTSQSLLKLMSIESVMPSNRLILCRPLLLLPLICPHVRVFPHESALCIWWPKY